MALLRLHPVPAKNPVYDFWNSAFHNTLLTQPMVNILESDDGFRIDLAAPGLSKPDIELRIEKDLLTVSSAKKAAPAADGIRVHRREFACGPFERVFRLPENIDREKVSATFTNGVLHIQLQRKAEPQPVVKTILIEG